MPLRSAPTEPAACHCTMSFEAASIEVTSSAQGMFSADRERPFRSTY
jgi:hypothetical protein